MRALFALGLGVAMAVLTLTCAPVSYATPALAPTATDASCTVTGELQTFAGDPVNGAWVELFAQGGDDATWLAATLTDEQGAFSFNSVPECASAELRVRRDGSTYRSLGHRFTAAGPNRVLLRPGHIGISFITTSSSWRPPLLVETWGSGGSTRMWLNSRQGQVDALAPACEYAVAYPFNNQGVEWFGDVAVAPGQRSETVTFNQADARSAWFATATWASGAPGSRIAVAFSNWPAGYQLEFSGVADAPDAVTQTWPSFTTAGRLQFLRTVRIPKNAPAGYAYEIHVRRLDHSSHLDLELHYQVATLQTSRRTSKARRAITLSGVIPTEGHWGDRKGKAKSVTLYRRTSAAGQPTHWNPAKDGWKKVATLRASQFGKYKSAALHPSRTTWYVVRYPGDGEYARGFTSVAKVTIQ